MRNVYVYALSSYLLFNITYTFLKKESFLIRNTNSTRTKNGSNIKVTCVLFFVFPSPSKLHVEQFAEALVTAFAMYAEKASTCA